MLNRRQLAVPAQVSAGDDLSTADSVVHRTCARALQRRRLVDITRRRGIWRAAITPAGRFYLDCIGRLFATHAPAAIQASVSLSTLQPAPFDTCAGKSCPGRA